MNMKIVEPLDNDQLESILDRPLPFNRYIVTGGCGFIGGHLSKRLIEQGSEVVVVDNQSVGKYTFDGPEYVLTSVENFCKNVKTLDAVDAVFHLANTPRVRRSKDFPAETIINNIGTTAAIGELCSRNNIPLYFAQSSSTIYSDRYSNAYTWSKVAQDEILEMYKQNYGLRYVNMYYYNVYGPGEADYGPYSTVIRRFKQKYLQGKPLEIFGDGTKTRDFTHVDDTVQGMLELLVDPDEPTEAHFGKGEPHSIQEIAEAYETDIVYKFNVEGEAQDTLCANPYIECPNSVISYIKNWIRKGHNERGSIN